MIVDCVKLTMETVTLLKLVPLSQERQQIIDIGVEHISCWELCSTFQGFTTQSLLEWRIKKTIPPFYQVSYLGLMKSIIMASKFHTHHTIAVLYLLQIKFRG